MSMFKESLNERNALVTADSPRRYKSKRQLLFLSCSFALSSFYYGYILIYLGSIPIATVITAYNIQLTEGQAKGLLNGCIPVGAILGAYFIRPLMKRYSRRKSILFTNIIASIAGFFIYVPNFYTLMTFRLIQGACVGIFSAIPPIIIKELSPIEVSGTVGTLVQLNITVGILIGYLLTYILKKITGDYSCQSFWQLVFAVPLITMLVQSLILIYVFPFETPKYWLLKGEREQAYKIIRYIYKEQHVQQVMKQKQQDVQKLNNKNEQLDETIIQEERQVGPKKDTTIAMLMSFHVAASQQLCGVNAINIYCGPIIEDIVGGELRLFIPSLLISMKLIGTLTTSYAISRLGRKTLLQIGLLVLCICNALIFIGFDMRDEEETSGSVIIIVSMFAYLIIFGFSLGPVVSIYVSESVQPRTLSIASSIHWICSAAVIILFPIIQQKLPNGSPMLLFLFFAVLCGISFIINHFFLIETKDKSERQIRQEYQTLKLC